MTFSCVIGQTDGVPLVRLSGELDLATADDFEGVLKSIEKPGVDRIVIDLRPLAFMDSSGLRAVIAADNRARKAGRSLELIRGSEAVHRVFRMTLLDDRLTFIDPVDDGEESDGEPSGEEEGG